MLGLRLSSSDRIHDQQITRYGVQNNLAEATYLCSRGRLDVMRTE